LRSLIYFMLAGLLPSIEPRYAVPLCIASGEPPAACIAVGIADVAILALLLPGLMRILDKLLPSTRLGRLYMRYRARVERIAEKHQGLTMLGLVGFIAVPLPGTGVWTGALLAYLIGFEGRAATLALLAGGLAGLAVTAAPTLLIGGVVS